MHMHRPRDSAPDTFSSTLVHSTPQTQPFTIPQDVCQLAAAACQQLAEACGADVQPQQPAPPPPPPRAGAAGRFARACLQLAHAVLCNAEVAGPLVGAGQHAAAADLAKAWVKHLVSALEALCARAPPQPASPIDGAPHEAADKEQGELCGALASACCLLLELALAATALVTGGGPPGAPREMCSLATLNLGWTSLGRLMSSPPPSARALGAAAAPPAAVRRAAGAALAQLVAAAAELRAPGQEGRLRVVRFWLGSALKVLGASPAAARGEAWAPLATAALALHASDRRGFELSEAAAAGAVRELLLPKLAAAMLAALNDEGAAPEEIERRLRGVAELAETGAISSSGVGSSGGEGGPDGLADTCGLLEQEGVGADLRVQAGVLLASSLLQHAPGMRPPLAEAAAGALLPWALRAAGAGAAGAALADHPEGLWRHARCAALSFLLGCAAAGPALQGAWRKGVLALQLMGGSPLCACFCWCGLTWLWPWLRLRHPVKGSHAAGVHSSRLLVVSAEYNPRPFAPQRWAPTRSRPTSRATCSAARCAPRRPPRWGRSWRPLCSCWTAWQRARRWRARAGSTRGARRGGWRGTWRRC